MTTAIAEYSATEAKLAELRQQYSATVWVVDTPERMLAAKKARAEIRKWRTDLESERKRIKQPALERCKQIDDEAKRITAELVKLETPIDESIKAEEGRKEREREEKARAEQRRIEAARADIDAISAIAAFMVGKDSVTIAVAIANLEQLQAERRDEFSDQSVAAKTSTLAKLRELLDAAHRQEQERERIRQEREELARLRAEQQERERAQAKADAEARAKIEAEEQAARERIAKADAEARALREQADKEAREIREREQARLDAEQAKIDAARKAETDKKRKADEDKAEKEREKKRAEQQRMDARELLQSFADRFGRLPEFARVTKAIADYFAEAGK